MKHPLDLTGLCKNRIENIVKSVSSEWVREQKIIEKLNEVVSIFILLHLLLRRRPLTLLLRTKFMFDELFIRTLLDWKFFSISHFFFFIGCSALFVDNELFTLFIVLCFSILFHHLSKKKKMKNFLACGSAFWSYWFFSLVILFTKGVEFHTFLNLYIRWNFMAWINHEKSHKSNIDGIKIFFVRFGIWDCVNFMDGFIEDF